MSRSNTNMGGAASTARRFEAVAAVTSVIIIGVLIMFVLIANTARVDARNFARTASNAATAASASAIAASEAATNVSAVSRTVTLPTFTTGGGTMPASELTTGVLLYTTPGATANFPTPTDLYNTFASTSVIGATVFVSFDVIVEGSGTVTLTPDGAATGSTVVLTTANSRRRVVLKIDGGIQTTYSVFS